MSTAISLPFPPDWTLADMLAQLGNVPAGRIRIHPTPGTATEADFSELQGRTDRLYELIDGVLVEKTMGYVESLVAGAVLARLREFVVPRRLGMVLGADGALRILPRQIRVPDVSFIPWNRFPEGRPPKTPILEAVPALAVEVLSSSNTAAEMERKLGDYFAAGVELVWYLDIELRQAKVYSSPSEVRVLHQTAVLTGGQVLPGFELPLKELFAEIP